MNKKQVAETLYSLFLGRQTAYARKKILANGSKVFFPDRKDQKDLPFTPDVCLSHLEGDISIGAYNLDENDNVRWAVVDFDGKRGDPLVDAEKIKNIFTLKLGLITWLERSQSGKGVHLWVFFNELIPARTVRKALAPWLPEFYTPVGKRTTSYDRLFPVQDVKGEAYGSLVALPLNGSKLVNDGRTTFIDSDGKVFSNQSEKLEEIYNKRNNISIIVDGAKNAPTVKTQVAKKTKPKISGGFKLLSPYGCTWLRSAYERAETLSEEEWWGALTQFTQLENGRTLAHFFSAGYPGYNKEQTDRKFDAVIKSDKPLTVPYVQEHFNACGENCVCAKLGLQHPVDIARIPLAKLEMEKKGQFIYARPLADRAVEIAREIDAGQRIGFSWGYDTVDDATELRPKNLIVVAARRSVGKTAVMIDAAVRGARRGIPQYILSFEMSYEDLALRLLSRISEVDQTLILTGQLDKVLWEQIEEGQREFYELPIFIEDSTRDIDKILDSVGELVVEHGVGCVWVDYLQLTPKRGNESKKEAVDRALEGYRKMAKILSVPVITLAQLNRKEEEFEGEDDLDSWLKDTGNIEQDADVIHYLRGKLGPGTVVRKWRLHKERHRASGLNFKFVFKQGIFKFEPSGTWIPQAEDGLNEFEVGNGFDSID